MRSNQSNCTVTENEKVKGSFCTSDGVWVDVTLVMGFVSWGGAGEDTVPVPIATRRRQDLGRSKLLCRNEKCDRHFLLPGHQLGLWIIMRGEKNIGKFLPNPSLMILLGLQAMKRRTKISLSLLVSISLLWLRDKSSLIFHISWKPMITLGHFHFFLNLQIIFFSKLLGVL